jgi:hypothetical protein
MSRRAKTTKTTRVQLELPETSMGRLSSLKDVTEAMSYAEVIKNALRLYEAVIEEAQKGGEFFIKRKDGTSVPYLVFGP